MNLPRVFGLWCGAIAAIVAAPSVRAADYDVVVYGGTAADLTYTVTNARFGVMPNWNQRLSEADIRSVALYVHGLGGGE